MDSFCALPWKHLDIARGGEARVCCVFKGNIPGPDGSSLNVRSHTLEEIWNCDFMRNLRQRMVEGKIIPECAHCHQLDAVGGKSYRQYMNRTLVGDDQKIEILKREAAADNYWLSTFPSYLVLNGGTACNLKCRMCFGGNSSRIELDLVHGQWRPGSPPPKEERWSSDPEVIRKNILLFPDQIETIEVVGGETFLLREVEVILQYLIDQDFAYQIDFCATTNATVAIPRWFPLTERFRSVNLTVSVDGFEKDFEYIRYPAKWETLDANLRLLKQRPNTRLSVIVTVQNCNILDDVKLLRYLDSLNIPFFLNLLDDPPYLSVTTMPPAARRLAASRLRQYAGSDCRPENREMVLGIARHLEDAGDDFDRTLMREFMLFTNDLDVTRGQSFKETQRELHDLLQEAGFTWTDETRFAPGPPRHSLPLVTASA